MVAVGEMCFASLGAVEKGVSRWWHLVKCVLRAWGRLKRGFEVMAVD